MSLYKIKNDVIIPLIAIIGYTNLLILGSQSMIIVYLYIAELLVSIYLSNVVKWRPQINARIIFSLAFWLIQIIVYFLIPSTNKHVYSFLFGHFF